MGEDDKLLRLFHTLNGHYSNKFQIEVINNECGQYGIQVSNDNGPCGFYSRDELVFEWVSRMLPPELPESKKPDRVITVQINESELHKVNEYKVIDRNTSLREFLNYQPDVSELHDYEVNEIIDTCNKAISEESKGVRVEIELGRHPSTDERTYTLMNVYLDEKDPDILTSDMVRFINSHSVNS